MKDATKETIYVLAAIASIISAVIGCYVFYTQPTQGKSSESPTNITTPTTLYGDTVKHVTTLHTVIIDTLYPATLSPQSPMGNEGINSGNKADLESKEISYGEDKERQSVNRVISTDDNDSKSEGTLCFTNRTGSAISIEISKGQQVIDSRGIVPNGTECFENLEFGSYEWRSASSSIYLGSSKLSQKGVVRVFSGKPININVSTQLNTFGVKKPESPPNSSVSSKKSFSPTRYKPFGSK